MAQIADLLQDLREAFSNSSPEAPPPGGMTFEQRAMLISALYDLKDRNRRPLREWLFELRRVLGYTDATRKLVEAIPEVPNTDVPSKQIPEIEKKASDIARIGIKLTETHPVAAFGGDVRHLITESVEAALARSRPVRLLRLLLPALFLLFSGGLLWGTFQVQGVKDAASRALTDMQTRQVAVSEAAAKANKDISDTAIKANNDIAQLNTNLLAGWKNQLQAEAQNQLQELTSSVQKAKAEAVISIQEELDKTVEWRKEQRRAIDAAAEAEIGSINQLAPIIEAAKSQATSKVEAELSVITQWGTEKKAEISAAAIAAQTAIAQISPTIEQAKVGATKKVEDELNGIKQWGIEKKAEISTATIAVQMAIAQFSPTVEQAKTEAAKNVEDELNGIKQWGIEKKAEISTATIAAQMAIAQFLPTIEQAKGEAARKVDDELNGIKQWGIEKKAEISTATIAAQTAIAQFLPTIEQAKGEAATRVLGVVGDITQWGRNQQEAVGKALDLQKNDVMREMSNRGNEVKTEQTRVKTQLALLLDDAHNGNDELHKGLLAAQEGERELRTRLEAIQKLVDQSMKLQTIIEHADAKSNLTFATLVNVLEWKDHIALVSGFFSLIAVFFSLIALRKA